MQNHSLIKKANHFAQMANDAIKIKRDEELLKFEQLHQRLLAGIGQQLGRRAARGEYEAKFSVGVDGDISDDVNVEDLVDYLEDLGFQVRLADSDGEATDKAKVKTELTVDWEYC